MAKVLVVDPGTQLVEEVLQYAGIRHPDIRGECGLREAIALWRSQLPPVVLIDLRVAPLPDVLSAIAAVSRRSHVIALAPTPPIAVVVAAIKAGAIDFMQRPCDPAELASAIGDAGRPCAHVLAEKLDDGLRASLGDPSMRLRSLSRQFGISASYASQLFRQHIGVPFRRRLLDHRVRKALDLLANSDEPLYLISERCGFSSPARLSEGFRRVVGQAPRRFRSMHRLRNTQHHSIQDFRVP